MDICGNAGGAHLKLKKIYIFKNKAAEFKKYLNN